LAKFPKCRRFSNSIHPATIPKSNKEIKTLLQCLFDDAIFYLDSAENFSKFKGHFQKSIIPKLKEKKLFGKFGETISRYAQTELIKTTFVTTNLEKIFIDTVKHTDEWMDKHSKAAKLKRGEFSPTLDDPELMADLLRIAYGDFIHLSILLSQMFFALEFSCRMMSALGCYNFALKISRAEVVQHDEVWKQLKRFGQKQSHECEICIVRNTCDFDVDFNALARIYAYAMKVRQISDYTTKFASFDILKSHLAEPPFIYFAALVDVMETNFYTTRDCIPSSPLKSTQKLVYLAEERKNLYPPISWINTIIMDFFKKRDDLRRKKS